MTVTIAEIAGLHIGTVESCAPTEVKVILESDAPQATAFNTGQPQGFPRINGYVLMPNEAGAVVGLITRVSIEPAPSLRQSTGDTSLIDFPAARRRLYVNPLGTLVIFRAPATPEKRLALHRGITTFPSVGDAVLLPSTEQLRAIVEASGSDTRVSIGMAPFANDAAVTIDPDKLFGRHLAVFGNTGSGKSCSVAGIIRWSVEAAAAISETPSKAANARFIVLDPNGEYLECFADLQRTINVEVYSVEPSPGTAVKQLSVPAWLWNSQEWAALLAAAPATQRPILLQALRVLRGAALARVSDDADEASGASLEKSPGEVAANPDAAAGASQELLLAAQIRAHSDYLQSFRAAGVSAYGSGAKMYELHNSLERLAEDADQHAANTNGNLATALVALGDATRAAYGRRQRPGPQGRIYKDGFGDNDLREIIEALSAVLDLLPVQDIAIRMSEDTPTRFDLNRLPGMISLLATLKGSQVQQHMAGLDLRLQTILADQRMMPVISPEGGGPDFPEWLKSHLGEGAEGRGQITVLDLSLVPSEVLTTVISVLGRIIFETAQRHRRHSGDTMPTVLVLEEAHNFVQRELSDNDETISASRCRHVFEKIAKEGRKFGVGLVLSSQRPAELSPTIVAQCNSFLLHRIVNDRDQELVKRLVSDSAGALLKELPSLPAQQAILIGIATEIPIVVDITAIGEAQRPKSRNPDLWDVWTGRRSLAVDFDGIVSHWRS
jgi:hypothetical protein